LPIPKELDAIVLACLRRIRRTAFKSAPNEEISWPRNNRQQMADAARRAGWTIVNEDLGLLKRDGMICLRRDS